MVRLLLTVEIYYTHIGSCLLKNYYLPDGDKVLALNIYWQRGKR